MAVDNDYPYRRYADRLKIELRKLVVLRDIHDEEVTDLDSDDVFDAIDKLVKVMEKEDAFPTDKANLMSVKKLGEILESLFDGKTVRNLPLSLYDIRECQRIYEAIVMGFQPRFISSYVKLVMDMCEMPTVEDGIGWRVVI